MGSPETGQRLGRAGVHRAPVHRDAEAARRAARQEDILRHAERRHDVQLLVHEAQAECRGIRGPRQAPRFLVDRDLHAVGMNDARQHPDKRGFSRPVLPHQRMHLTGPKCQVDALEDAGGAIALFEAG
jgi:hypothetical protein